MRKQGAFFFFALSSELSFLTTLLVSIFPDINLTSALYDRCSYLHVTDKDMEVMSLTESNIMGQSQILLHAGSNMCFS